ncbi:hypothetical protein ABKV19_018991 [Rosa sericea]
MTKLIRLVLFELNCIGEWETITSRPSNLLTRFTDGSSFRYSLENQLTTAVFVSLL